jgi:hypothetical protein
VERGGKGSALFSLALSVSDTAPLLLGEILPPDVELAFLVWFAWFRNNCLTEPTVPFVPISVSAH